MNRRSSGLFVSRAVAGFLQFKTAEAAIASTLASYGQHLRDWVSHSGGVELGSVTSDHLCTYMAYLRTDYKPRRLQGDDRH
jgi:integrase/recombinase XerD